MKITARLEWKLQDMWVGVFWRGWYRACIDEELRLFQDTGNPYDFLHIWICVLPCVPLHITLRKETEEIKQLWEKYRAWCAEHLRPGELISIGYFVKVLDYGENEMARKWGKRP